MKKEVGKTMALLLAVCMMVTMFAGSVFAQDIPAEAEPAEVMVAAGEQTVAEETLPEISADVEDAILQQEDVPEFEDPSVNDEEVQAPEESVTEETADAVWPENEETEEQTETLEEDPVVSLNDDPLPSTTTTVYRSGDQAVVKWDAVTGASGYALHRSVDGGAFEPIYIASEKNLTYRDSAVQEGVSYRYLAVAFKMVGEEQQQGTMDETKSVSFRINTTPVLKSTAVTEKGIKVTWKSVPEAAKYKVYRKVKGAKSWTAVGETTKTTYTDETAAAGTVYYYTVNSFDSNDIRGNYDLIGLEAVYLPKVPITSLTNSGSNIVLKWNKVTGADGYRIYKRVKGASKWTTLGKSCTKTTYSDAKGTAGTEYEYFIKAYKTTNEKTYLGFGDETVYQSIVKLSAPVLKKTAVKATGIKLTWNKSAGAGSYVIFRKTSKKGAWTELDAVKKTAYIDKTAEEGKVYYYTVAARKSGSLSSKNEDGIAGAKLATPELSKAASTKKGIKVTWKKVSGAYNYRVYRKSGSGSYKLVKKTTSTSYVDPTTASGKTYTYTVKASAKAADLCLSLCDTDGVSAKASNMTGIVKIKGKKYYYVNGVKQKGWQKINGKWYYFNKTNGRMYGKGEHTIDNTKYHFTASGMCKDYKDGPVSDSMIKKAQKYSSATNYLILVECGKNRCSVFQGSKGNWKQLYFWPCTTGRPSDPTVKGQYSITGNRGYSFGDGTYTCYWYSGFYGGYLFHSTKYYPGTMKPKDPRLGMSLSLGCVRLEINNAKWIYDNIPIGTKVVTYKD